MFEVNIKTIAKRKGKLFCSCLAIHSHLSLVTQKAKNLPAMWETQARSLGREDSLAEGMATHSSDLAWRIPMDGGAWQATVHGVAKSQTRLSYQIQCIITMVWLQ